MSIFSPATPGPSQIDADLHVSKSAVAPSPRSTAQLLGSGFGKAMAWSKSVFPSAFKSAAVPPSKTQWVATNGEQRYRELKKVGYAAKCKSNMVGSTSERLKAMLYTRMLVAGLNEKGRKVGLDLRHKLDVQRHTLGVLSNHVNADRIKTLQANLSMLESDRNLAVSTVLNGLPSTTEDTCTALGAALPLHLMSPTAFRSWIAAHGPLVIEVSRGRRRACQKVIAELSEFMDLVLGKEGFKGVKLLNAQAFMQALQAEYQSNPVQGWTASCSGSLQLDEGQLSFQNEWAQDEDLVFELRQRQTPLWSLSGLVPRAFKGPNFRADLNDKVEREFPHTRLSLKVKPMETEKLFRTPHLVYTDTEQHTDDLLKALPTVLKGDASARAGHLAGYMGKQLAEFQGALLPQTIVLTKAALQGLGPDGKPAGEPITPSVLKKAIARRFTGESGAFKEDLFQYIRAAITLGRNLRNQLLDVGNAPQFPANMGVTSARREAVLLLAGVPLEFYTDQPASWAVKVHDSTRQPPTLSSLWGNLTHPASSTAAAGVYNRAYALQSGPQGTDASPAERLWTLGKEKLIHRQTQFAELRAGEVDPALGSTKRRTALLFEAGARNDPHWESQTETALAERMVIAGLHSGGDVVAPDLRTVQPNAVQPSGERWRAYAPQALERLERVPADELSGHSLQTRAVLLLSVLPLDQLMNPNRLIQGCAILNADGEPTAVSVRDLLFLARDNALADTRADRISGQRLHLSEELLASLKANINSEQYATSPVPGIVRRLGQNLLASLAKLRRGGGDPTFVPSEEALLPSAHREPTPEQMADALESSGLPETTEPAQTGHLNLEAWLNDARSDPPTDTAQFPADFGRKQGYSQNGIRYDYLSSKPVLGDGDLNSV